jgi:hypothetical protein
MKTFKELLKESNEHWVGTTNPDINTVNIPQSNNHNYRENFLLDKNDHYNLNDHERDAVEDYVSSAALINSHHRHNDVPEKWHNLLNERTKHLDSALNKNRTRHNVHLWRGIIRDDSKKILQDLNPGDTFHDKGYVSTSFSPDAAGGFGSHLFHIKVPKGSRALVPSYHGLGKAHEQEVILPRNSKFRYLNSEKINGTNIHHLEHIPED